MPERGDDEVQAASRGIRSDQVEAVATLVAIVWASVMAILLAIFGGNISLVGFMAIAPFIAAPFARPSRVALVGVLATLFAFVISPPSDGGYAGLNHTLRIVTQLAAAAVAIWLSYLARKWDVQLYTARTETRSERRRRVTAETAQRMQTMARALTTAADPAQVADAVFAAIRDELHIDAATFALLDEQGQLYTLRRFGYEVGEPMDWVLAALQPTGPVLGKGIALLAESLDDLIRQRPDVFELLRPSPFHALALVPLVVSDRIIGAVVVYWVDDRELSGPDQSFLFAITGAAAQAVDRARLTLTEFINLERGQHLHQLSSALAAATTPGDVANSALAAGRRALGAHSAVVRIPVPGEAGRACLASSGEPSLLSGATVPLGSRAGTAFSEERTVVTRVAPDGRDDTSAAVVPTVREALAQPVTVIEEPLLGSTGVLGVLSFALVDQPDPSESVLRFLATLAGLTAQALERAQLFEHEREALLAAEAARERLSLLSEVTRLLSSSLNPTTVIRRTMALVEGRLADSCMVQVPTDAGLVRLDVREPEPATQGHDTHEKPATSAHSESVAFNSEAPAAVAFRTGRMQLAPVTPIADDAGRPHGISTALAVPLTANGEVIGVMTFVDGPNRVFGADDKSLANEVASRAGVALANATRYQREHVVAEVLQRAVLPDSLPEVEGLRLDAEYQAAVAGTYAGGDWYDVFELDDDTVFFSVGDVMGKGAPAAALMGQVRSAIRAYAISGMSPTQVLSCLDRLFDTLNEERVVTAVIGTITPSTGCVVLSNAGHPPPLIVRSDGHAAFCPMQRSLLVAAGLGTAPRPNDEFILAPGDSLVMYSDGLIERRGEMITQGMERLSRVATELARGEWPNRPALTLASMLTGEERADDVVVLSLHYTGVAERINDRLLGTTASGMSTLHLEPVVESTPIARHWIVAQLRDMPSEVTESAALLTSELVTNGVLHAATPMCVTLHILSDRIRVDVADESGDFPAIKEYGREAATGRGLTLFDTLASKWGVQPVEHGKIVWFEVVVDPRKLPSGPSDSSFRLDLTGNFASVPGDGRDGSEKVTVRLLGIPVALLQKSGEEYEALFRELRLMSERAHDSNGAPALSERLALLVSELGTRFTRLGPGLDETWQRAVDAKVDRFDWSLELSPSAAVACEFYDAVLDEVDEVKEVGVSQRLLTLPASPSSVAVRQWFLAELIGQLRGKAPVPWTDSTFHAELLQFDARRGR